MHSFHVPYAQELDLDIDRKGLLERGRLLPPDPVRPCVHLVCKRNLLPIVSGQQADLVDHACKAGLVWLNPDVSPDRNTPPPSCVGSPRKS